jgi:arylsulfatase A-like enzyme
MRPDRRTLHVARGTLACAALAAALVLTGCRERPAPPPPAAEPAGPNILFLLIDTLRADRLGCYGHERKLAPTIDGLAAEGVVFERAVSQSPWTQPSMAALFTGMYPGAIMPVLEYRISFSALQKQAELVRVLGDDRTTLPEALHALGYATAGISANPYVVREFGFAQGFEHFDASFAAQITSGSRLNEAAAAWLAQRDASRPFFLFMHYMDVHGPYDAGPEFLDPLLEQVDALPEKQALTPQQMKNLTYLRVLPTHHTDRPRHDRLGPYREYWVARYEAGVAELDHHLADLRARLQRMGLWDELAVVVASDHGEGLCEHNYWDHGYTVHHTELHVPLIFRWPGALPAGKRVTELVRLMDVMPTVLELLDVVPPEGLQAASLLPYIEGDPPKELVFALAEGLKMGPEQVGLYYDEWKLALPSDPPKELLYRYTSDPLERENLARQNPVMRARLIDLALAQKLKNERLAAQTKRERVELSPEQLQRLKSLGYVGGSGEKP